MKPRKQDDLHHKIAAFYGRLMADPHHRYRSWEHCYRFFRSRTREALASDADAAALQLGFYLASWGMYRGSSFLLQKAYTVHKGVVQRLLAPEFSQLWEQEVGSEVSHVVLAQPILNAVATIKEEYAPFGMATDTLATKVLLGMLACLPACDRFFVDGFKESGRPYSRVNKRFVTRVLQFCRDYAADLRNEQAWIGTSGGPHYPVMKLVDMYFWEIGYERANARFGEDRD